MEATILGLMVLEFRVEGFRDLRGLRVLGLGGLGFQGGPFGASEA